MTRFIVLILIINTAIAFENDKCKKLILTKLDKITETLPYKLIDHFDDIRNENIDTIQKIDNLLQDKKTSNPFINFIQDLNDKTENVWYNDKRTINQLFKSSHEDFNKKLDIIFVTILNTYSTTINQISDIKLNLNKCNINF